VGTGGRAQHRKVRQPAIAAIAHVFTIGHVAKLLGEEENRLYDLSTDIIPEDGCIWLYGVGKDGVPAFTKDGVENLR
jgi:hypothetical protein